MNPFVNIHTHNHIDDKDLIQITNIDIDNLTDVDVTFLFSVGIHPWESRQSTDNGQATLLKLSQIIESSDSQLLKAIGECGLDRACNSDFESQKEIFIRQIEISEQYHKPLIIHCVRAYPDIISIRKETKAKQAWIIHGFQGNEQTTEQLLKHEGIYLSLGEVLLKNEDKARRLLEIIPSDRLFLETDTAGISIEDIYETVSRLSGIKSDTLRNNIFTNFVKIFGQI